MAEHFPETVVNHDVVYLYDNLSRFYVEISKSQSSGVNAFQVYDQARLMSYVDAMKKSITWMNSMPLLDLPETHPRAITLEPFPSEINVENENVNYVLRLVRILAVELTNGQSARLGSTLINHDLRRTVDILKKIESFMTDFVSSSGTDPLDVPESSPEDPLTTDGNLGI